MGYYKKYISNEQIFNTFKHSDFEGVFKLFSGNYDSISLEGGLASDVHDLWERAGEITPYEFKQRFLELLSEYSK